MLCILTMRVRQNRAAWGPLEPEALIRRPIDRHGERSGNTREITDRKQWPHMQ